MADPNEVAMWMKTHAGKSRAQLESLLQDRVPECAEHVALRELIVQIEDSLRQRASDDQEVRHKESLEVARESLSRSESATHIAKWAIVIAVLSLIVAIVQTFWH